MLEKDGAQLFSGLLSSADLADLELVFDALPVENAGARISTQSLWGLRLFASIRSIVSPRLGVNARAVRAILFDKNKTNNWALGWHQDRTIAVKARTAVDGFGPWTVKSGMHHVAPPFDFLERMVTVRVHLDAVNADNSPLLIAPGSHAAGLVPEQDIDAVVTRCGQRQCLADAGDIWMYSTPILHASARSQRPARRRVVQFDYSADNLPGGLEWASDA